MLLKMRGAAIVDLLLDLTPHIHELSWGSNQQNKLLGQLIWCATARVLQQRVLPVEEIHAPSDCLKKRMSRGMNGKWCG